MNSNEFTPEQLAAYEKLKEQRIKEGTWYETAEQRANAMNQEIAETNLTLQPIAKKVEPKHKWKPSAETLQKIHNYFDFIATPKKVTAKAESKDIEPYMDLKEAKKEFWTILQTFIPNYQITEHTRPILDSLTRYFVNDPSFKGDLKKGIALTGNVGTGKTNIMKAFSKFTNQFSLPSAFEVESIKRIARQAQTDGIQIVPKYTFLIKCIDDVGYEEKALYMGNRICVLTELINISYDKFCSSGKICHITSNLSLDGGLELGGMIERYGVRTTDRMREMFNFIHLGGKSWR